MHVTCPVRGGKWAGGMVSNHKRNFPHSGLGQRNLYPENQQLDLQATSRGEPVNLNSAVELTAKNAKNAKIAKKDSYEWIASVLPFTRQVNQFFGSESSQVPFYAFFAVDPKCG
jgi:hypothetical protein